MFYDFFAGFKCFLDFDPAPTPKFTCLVDSGLHGTSES